VNERTDELYGRIYEAVTLVPHGKVATYGDIAAVVGNGCDARTVGYVLNELPKGQDAVVPWQRIINSSGGISTRGTRQRRLLEQEGVVFDARERIDLGTYRWEGPEAEWAEAHGFHALRPRRDDAQLRLF
jgi:methylated-DNA-protein-cysteine methyltransferase-like protein